MTKTISVLLSLCIMLGSCGRDQKILDLEKREKEEAAQSVKEHIDELEGELEVYKKINVQKDHNYSQMQTEHEKLRRNHRVLYSQHEVSKKRDSWVNLWKDPITIAPAITTIIVGGALIYIYYRSSLYRDRKNVEAIIYEDIINGYENELRGRGGKGFRLRKQLRGVNTRGLDAIVIDRMMVVEGLREVAAGAVKDSIEYGRRITQLSQVVTSNGIPLPPPLPPLAPVPPGEN